MTSTIVFTPTEASALPAILTNARVQLTRYVYCPSVIIGNIGNIFNIIVFCQEPLRTSVCSIYFLIVSIANLMSINIGYLTRVLAMLDVPDPSRNVAWYCKGRAYISGLSLTLARHFLCLIAIDRVFVTSTRVPLRQLSSFKTAKWLVPVSCLSWAIFYVHTWIGYENTRGGTSCGRRAGFYSTFTTVCTVSIDAILPIIIMTVFTLLMLKQVHALQLRKEKNAIIAGRQVTTGGSLMITSLANRTSNQDRTNHEANNRRTERQREKQLTKLSLVQVLLYIIFNLPNAVYVVYMLVVTNETKTPDRSAIESFVSLFASILTYIYCTLNFYIYTLSSTTYRAQTKQALRKCFNMRQTQVFPIQN
ncbi:unnamed protein product [Rotaria sp. Silwood1]|nr:unnamed protein product [Rotaria sp. Silwood1]CAF4995148.1 unnamed protein product [Rotaria sp. Silwood1]